MNAVEQWLVQLYREGMSSEELSKEFQRTRGAIESRLVKLGEVTLV